MRILLIGEFSNVHWTLAEGLRRLGHDVTVASDGDAWKNYKRDFNLNYDDLYGKILFHSHLYFPSIFPSLQFVRIKDLVKSKSKFDIVQLISLLFIHDRPQNIVQLFKFLKKNCEKIFLSINGNDSYFVQAAVNGKLRYSVYTPYLNGSCDARYFKDFFLFQQKEYFELNQMVASECNGIIARAFEYYLPYEDYFSDKLKMIPFSINLDEEKFIGVGSEKPIKFLVGKQLGREIIKGTDLILESIEYIKNLYPKDVSFEVVENLPYNDWRRKVEETDVLLDQVYCYSQGMSALQGMALGKICFAGSEPEYLDFLNIRKAPVYNLLPDVDYNNRLLTDFLSNDVVNLQKRSKESRQFIEKFHDHIKNAQAHIDFWNER